MNEFIWIYLYTSLSSLKTLLAVITVIGLIIVGILSLIAWVEDLESMKKKIVNAFTLKSVRAWLTATVILIVFVPGTNKITTIIGGGLAWKATQIEGIEKLPVNLVNAMNNFLVTINEEDK